MRCIYITFLLLFFNFACLAKGNETVILNEKIIGKNLLTDEDIKAKEYIFTDDIFDLYIDSPSKLFTVQLRKNVLMYDPIKKEVLWSKILNYSTQNFEQYGNFLIQTTAYGKSYSVDIETGKKQHDLKNTILFADQRKGIGIGYKHIGIGGANAEILEGINLGNGKVKWTRPIPFDWDQTHPLNDSVLLIVSQGIHAINLNNGQGWDYKIKTWYQDNNGWVTAERILSNIITDSNRLYMAGIGKLACLDEAGREIWVHDYKNDYLSSSVLCHSDSILYLINKGIAIRGKMGINHGRPFIAAYDKNTGKELFSQDFPYKKNRINDYDFDKDHIYLLFNDRIIRYSRITNTITEKTFNSDSVGNLKLFIGGSAYLSAQGSYQSLRFSDVTRQYFLTDKEKVFILDNMNIIAHAKAEDFYHLYYVSELHQFIEKNGWTTLLDNDGRPLAKLKMSKRSFLIGKTLYDVHYDRIVEVNLENLLIN